MAARILTLLLVNISFSAFADDTATERIKQERIKQLLDQQRFSYALGYQIAQNLRRQGVEIHVGAFNLAIQHYFQNGKPILSVKDMEAILKTQKGEIRKRQSALAQKNQEAGRAFLAENRRKDGIQELPNGLQYRVIEPGKGSKPQLTDTVAVHYRGSLLNGKEFDRSYIRGEPSTFQLTKC